MIDLAVYIFGTIGFLISILVALPFIYIFATGALVLIYRNVNNIAQK
ncbi:hypothetical protein [Methanobrevibacter arboriphilus]|nr:hypothetical protein [Methanobrevibacter arboriphilus]